MQNSSKKFISLMLLSSMGLTDCRVAKYGHSVLLNIALANFVAGYLYLTIQQLSGAFLM